MFVDGDDVCLFYDLVTHTPAGTAFIAEWHHVTDGKIDRVSRRLRRAPVSPPMMGH